MERLGMVAYFYIGANMDSLYANGSKTDAYGYTASKRSLHELFCVVDYSS